MTQLAYICGKITGEPNLNRAKFAAAEKFLRSIGYRTINPHTFCSDIDPKAHWSTFMKRCVSEIPKVDVIVVLDDWYKSKGAQIEVELAGNLQMPVIEIETMQPINLQFRAFPTFKGVMLNIR